MNSTDEPRPSGVKTESRFYINSIWRDWAICDDFLAVGRHEKTAETDCDGFLRFGFRARSGL
jgi:hypothetical protein